MVAMEGVQKLFYRSDRQQHSVTYSLLFVYCRSPSYRLPPQKESGSSALCGHPCQRPARFRPRFPTPGPAISGKGAENLLRLIRGAILESVNSLTTQQRRALILVEVEGVGYREVAQRLEMKETDVGNFVRRTRKVRDANFIAALRQQDCLGGHIGFAELQRSKELRTNLLRWAADIGDGFCYRCVNEAATLHTADQNVTHRCQAALTDFRVSACMQHLFTHTRAHRFEPGFRTDYRGRANRCASSPAR